MKNSKAEIKIVFPESIEDIYNQVSESYQADISTEKLIKQTKDNLKEDLKSLKEKSLQLKNIDIDTLIDKQLSHIQLEKILPPVIWGMPKIVNGPNNEFIDACIYSSKAKEKTVYIPFTDIHKKLIEANLIMRDGIDHQPNYLTAHLAFIISDRPYTKDNGKYTGRRKFIDFPIINYEANEPKNLGQYIYREVIRTEEMDIMRLTRSHSEEALRSFLENEQIMESIVSNIEAKVKKIQNSGTEGSFKVYGVCLFLNSQSAICGKLDLKGNILSHSGCERRLKNLMSANAENRFLCQLRNELQKKGLIISNKNNKPYIFISVSTHRYYSESTNSLQSNEVLNKDLRINTEEYVNVKKLAGKVILCTPEKWIDRINTEERQKNIQRKLDDKQCKKPFYTGFKSSGGTGSFLDAVKEIDQSKCFDGVDISF